MAMSASGPKQTWAVASQMFAFGRKADIMTDAGSVCDWPFEYMEAFKLLACNLTCDCRSKLVVFFDLKGVEL